MTCLLRTGRFRAALNSGLWRIRLAFWSVSAVRDGFEAGLVLEEDISCWILSARVADVGRHICAVWIQIKGCVMVSSSP